MYIIPTINKVSKVYVIKKPKINTEIIIIINTKGLEILIFLKAYVGILLIIKKEANKIIKIFIFSNFSNKSEKLVKLNMIGRSKIPAPAGDGTPVKKFSNKEFWELFDEILNLASLKQQHTTNIRARTQPMFPYLFKSQI